MLGCRSGSPCPCLHVKSTDFDGTLLTKWQAWFRDRVTALGQRITGGDLSSKPPGAIALAFVMGA